MIKKCALLQKKPVKCSHKYLVGIYASLILYISSNPNDKATPIFALHNDMKSDSNRCINVSNVCRTWEKKLVTAWMASPKKGLARTLNGRRQLCPQLGAFRWLDFERRMQLQKPVVETRKSDQTLYRRFLFHKDLQAMSSNALCI